MDHGYRGADRSPRASGPPRPPELLLPAIEGIEAVGRALAPRDCQVVADHLDAVLQAMSASGMISRRVREVSPSAIMPEADIRLAEFSNVTST
ncbi:Uncharacterised protein [Amycolatopsis camponoti]|uniref:Uncharacterized protein n=1 Tax=Amycolatopsis camponoti TaxID=2606593 RepID=A0A6I8MAU5_9PSEU|nr:hypothetical protein [Amycolatopsis camponoti]VVJ24868.1 Uncharacterised protein [Amycolatopsis camponoti]